MEWMKIGRVSAVYAARCAARVTYADRDGMVSKELPIVVAGSQYNKSYWMPAIGEQVVCLFLPNGNGDGVIVGSIYTEQDDTPVQEANTRCITFSDGAKIQYDAKKHQLLLDFSGIPAAEILIKNCKITKVGVTESG
jgi:phage baseplate assembly protein V